MVLSALQEKWTHVDQDEYDVSSIDGSTFKRENIINGRWSTMKKRRNQVLWPMIFFCFAE